MQWSLATVGLNVREQAVAQEGAREELHGEGGRDEGAGRKTEHAREE
jgi:hypothetical protein